MAKSKGQTTVGKMLPVWRFDFDGKETFVNKLSAAHSEKYGYSSFIMALAQVENYFPPVLYYWEDISREEHSTANLDKAYLIFDSDDQKYLYGTVYFIKDEVPAEDWADLIYPGVNYIKMQSLDMIKSQESS